MPRLFRFFGNSASNAAGFAIGSAIHPTLRPITQEVANATWARYPFVPLTPEQAAAAVERGEMVYGDAEDEARLSGTNAKRFKIIERLAGLAPSTEQLLSMRRRGAITDARMHKGFVQGNVRSEWADALAALADVLLTPGEVARLTALGFVTPAQGKALAAEIGVNGGNFDRLVNLAQSGPSVDRLFSLWNRGEIDEADVNRGLVQEGVRPEWRDKLKALRFHAITTSDAIRMAVKDVFDKGVVAEFGLDAEFPDAFLPVAARSGVTEQEARWQWAAHWRNVSPTQLYRMLWRGEINETQFDKGLKVADYAPFWRGKLKAIAYLVPGRIDLRRFYQAGIISEAEVFEGYKRLGYTPEVARWQTDFAKIPTGSATRDLTVSQLTAEYQGQFIERDEYLAAIRKAGFSEAEAQQLADLADARRVSRARDQFVNRIHAQYVGHKIDLTAAKAALRKAKISARAIDLMAAEWENERAVNVATLTPAQIVRSYKAGLLTRAAALAELAERGYSDNDARILLGLAAARLTAAQIVAEVRHRNITEAEGVAQLVGLLYTTEDAQALLASQIAELTSKQIQEAVDAKTITREEGLQRLAGIGYRPADAALLLPIPPPDTAPAAPPPPA